VGSALCNKPLHSVALEHMSGLKLVVATCIDGQQGTNLNRRN